MTQEEKSAKKIVVTGVARENLLQGHFLPNNITDYLPNSKKTSVFMNLLDRDYVIHAAIL